MKVTNYMDDTYYIIINISLIFCFICGFLFIIVKPNLFLLYLGIILVWIFIMGMLFTYNRSYEFKDNKLLVTIGFIKIAYLYKYMEKCYITSNNEISLATSKKRICIKYQGKNIFISPDKMEEVLFKLVEKKG